MKRTKPLKQHSRSLIQQLLDGAKPLEKIKKLKSPGDLQELIDLGYVFKDGDLFCITRIGRDHMERKVPKINKVWGHEVYRGSELQMGSMRPGAYDFLKCPSLMGEKRVIRKIWEKM